MPTHLRNHSSAPLKQLVKRNDLSQQGVRSALADFIRVAFRVLSLTGHLPTLVGGGYTCIVKQSNSNVT